MLRPFCVGFTKKCNNQDLEDLLCTAATGLPNLKDDDQNHDPRGTNDLKEVVNKLIPDGSKNLLTFSVGMSKLALTSKPVGQ